MGTLPGEPTKVRRFLTGRALGLAVVAALLMSAMVILGLWQLGVYDEHQRDDARARIQGASVELDRVLGPDQAFPADGIGQPVTVRGRYLADEQMYVRGFEGADHTYAVVTPLLVDNGSAILVLRGSRDEPSDVPPRGALTVHAVLEPSQPEGSALGADRVTDGIRVAALVEGFDEDLYSGFVVLLDSTPEDQLAPVQPPLPDPSRWAGIRNLVYALQWWIFAGFVAFMWWRIVVDADEVPDHAVG
jgi:surfeit locus 1 family protein